MGASGGGSLVARGSLKVASGPGTQSCHPSSGSCPAPETCGQEVGSLITTLQLGAGSACAGVPGYGAGRGAGRPGNRKGDQPAVAAPRALSPQMSGLNGDEALGEGTLHLCTEFTKVFLYQATHLHEIR